MVVKGVQRPSRGAHISWRFGIAPACWSIFTGWLFEDERGGCRWTVCVSGESSSCVAGILCLSSPDMERHIEEDEVRSSADLRIRKSQVGLPLV